MNPCRGGDCGLGGRRAGRVAGVHSDRKRCDQRLRPPLRSQAVAEGWSNSPVADELPRLLADRGLSVRELGRRTGIDHGHISRIMHQQRGKVASGDLAGRIAVALGLPVDHFPEYRRAVVIAVIDEDPLSLNRLYREVSGN